jgi:hypothetical protein
MLKITLRPIPIIRSHHHHTYHHLSLYEETTKHPQTKMRALCPVFLFWSALAYTPIDMYYVYHQCKTIQVHTVIPDGHCMYTFYILNPVLSYNIVILVYCILDGMYRSGCLHALIPATEQVFHEANIDRRWMHQSADFFVQLYTVYSICECTRPLLLRYTPELAKFSTQILTSLPASTRAAPNPYLYSCLPMGNK